MEHQCEWSLGSLVCILTPVLDLAQDIAIGSHSCHVSSGNPKCPLLLLPYTLQNQQLL